MAGDHDAEALARRSYMILLVGYVAVAVFQAVAAAIRGDDEGVRDAFFGSVGAFLVTLGLLAVCAGVGLWLVSRIDKWQGDSGGPWTILGLVLGVTVMVVVT